MPEKNHLFQQLILDFPAHPEYRFENFIVSQGSTLAFNAAQQICEDNPPSYHTLYLYGGKNLGKTHLLISIGNYIAENRLGKKAVYIHCSEFIKKIETGDENLIHSMVAKLKDVDYFLLDDVEWVAGKKKAQEKLYLIYNSLVENKKNSVFTGAKSPEYLLSTESYLTSRFKWGMTTEIQPIDDAASAKIIAKLGKDIDLSIPKNIIEYLLTHTPRDFLSLKNSVAKINRESYIKKRKVTIPLVKDALNLP